VIRNPDPPFSSTTLFARGITTLAAVSRACDGGLVGWRSGRQAGNLFRSGDPAGDGQWPARHYTLPVGTYAARRRQFAPAAHRLKRGGADPVFDADTRCSSTGSARSWTVVDSAIAVVLPVSTPVRWIAHHGAAQQAVNASPGSSDRPAAGRARSRRRHAEPRRDRGTTTSQCRIGASGAVTKERRLRRLLQDHQHVGRGRDVTLVASWF
jgi:hypothetical protein